MKNYEKLGAFYLGRIFNSERGETTSDTLLYDAKDLTTHAMCVGMTGSGKTGLCISLLEEAAMDGIPALIIDPKGDLGNLMLTFPDLKPESFRQWIDPSEAARKGFTPDEFAENIAETWQNGLADWDQDAERIKTLKSKADFTIYTPGSNAGIPLTILKSFNAPPKALLDDSDAIRDRVQASVSGLLAMLGVDADPIQSREHILLSNILHRAWREGRDLDLAQMIREIQSPPFEKLGVFDLESFYPSKERFGLAMRLNNMLASPGFESWMEGEPLDIQRLLWTSTGQPRISIISIAHLSEAERMFFVTILLNETVAWMRTQPGTSSLRALLYMDEIFGYFPPTANPPSKYPMLTLLKQARAYGLGCVLATQNPVDLDYKGLSNTGTWFIGRLQTERDKNRVLDGLEGASGEAGAKFDRSAMEKTLAGLGNRVFLMNNVHEDGAVLFQTRWAMSYLRGPLTRTQIETLMAAKKSRLGAQPPAPAAAPALEAPTVMAAPPQKNATAKPTISPDVTQRYLALTSPISGSSSLIYRPLLIAESKLHFVRSTAKIDKWIDLQIRASFPAEGSEIDWGQASFTPEAQLDLDRKPCNGAQFSDPPESATVPRNYASWGKQVKDHLYQSYTMDLWKCAKLKVISEPGEAEGDFKVRIRQAAHEERDLAVAKLQKKYAPKLDAVQERMRKAEMKIEKEEEQYKGQKLATIISVGSTLLGAFLGRKAASIGTLGRARSTMSRATRTSKEKSDIARAEEDLEALRVKLEELEETFEAETEEMKDKYDPDSFEVEEVKIRPRKSDIKVDTVMMAWTPWIVASDGIAERAF